MFSLNEAWASTSNDLIVNSKFAKAMDGRIAVLEIEHCSPGDVRALEKITKSLDMKIDDVAARSDATALRGFQTAFFSETLLQAFEELYKGEEKREQPSQAVADMVFLLRSAFTSIAMDKNNIVQLVEGLLAAKLSDFADQEKHRKVVDVETTESALKEVTRALTNQMQEMPKNIRDELVVDKSFLEAVVAAMSTSRNDSQFTAGIEAVVGPLIKTARTKVKIYVSSNEGLAIVCCVTINFHYFHINS